MASLQFIPAELLDLILLELHPSDIFNLALTSKKLSSATVEERYSDIQWTWNGGHGSKARVTRDLLRPRSIPTGPLYLLRTILERPDLALRVSHLGINFDPAWKDLGCETPLYPRHFRLLNDLIQQIQLPDPEMWKSAITRGSVDAAVALLVSQLSNLKTLSVGYNSFFEEQTCIKDTFLGSMLQHTVTAGPAARISRIPQLSEVSLTAGKPSYQLQCPPSSLALLHAPNLQSATFVVDYSPHAGQIPQLWPAAPPCTVSLTSLRFKRSVVGADALSLILPSTPYLKVFELDHVFRPQHPAFTGSLFTAALAHCAATLERVVIATSLSPRMPGGYQRPGRWISSRLNPLREFSALLSLEIDLLYLTADCCGLEPAVDAFALSDVLPPRIVTLRIRHDFMHSLWEPRDISLQIYMSLEQLLPLASECTPELRSIEILETCGEFVQGRYKSATEYEGHDWVDSEEEDGNSDDEDEDDYLRYSREEISELCEGYGINCTWVRLRQPCASLDS